MIPLQEAKPPWVKQLVEIPALCVPVVIVEERKSTLSDELAGIVIRELSHRLRTTATRIDFHLCSSIDEAESMALGDNREASGVANKALVLGWAFSVRTEHPERNTLNRISKSCWFFSWPFSISQTILILFFNSFFILFFNSFFFYIFCSS
jgi:hypothetical protein